MKYAITIRKNKTGLEIILNRFVVPRTRLELTRANAHHPLKVARLPIPPPGQSLIQRRAENETRTRDPNLGKVMLYQLSYFRNMLCEEKETRTPTT